MEFGCTNFKYYHDIFLKTDAFVQADNKYEKFTSVRSSCASKLNHAAFPKLYISIGSPCSPQQP